MTSHECKIAKRELDAHSNFTKNKMGNEEYRVIEKKLYVPYVGAVPRWLIISDKLCVF